MRSYAEVWRDVTREFARTEIALTQTIGEYFAPNRVGTMTRTQRLVVKKWLDKPMHDFFIELCREKIPYADFRNLTRIYCSPFNHFWVFYEYYRKLTH